MKKRIFVCGLHQESNSFNPVFTPLEMFTVTEGEEIPLKYKGVKIAIGGAVDFLAADDSLEAVWGTFLKAPSGAPLKDSVTDWFLSKTEKELKAAGKIDGVILSLHGATMSESSFDVCGDIAAIVRKTVGQEIPIAASFDMHGNITDKLLLNVDLISGYREYPHIDQYETGIRAASLLKRVLSGEKLYMAAAKIPMIAPAHGYTTKEGKMLSLCDAARAMVEDGRLFDYTVFEVQPWLDCPEMESVVITVSKDENEAIRAADELAGYNFNIREELLGERLFSVAEVIEKARNNRSGKPVVLVDSADSRNAGSTSDSAEVLKAVLPFKQELSAAVSVCDAAAVEMAFSVGVGGVADFILGGSLAPNLFSRVEVKNARVKSLHDGSYLLHGPIERGNRVECGRVAVLEIGKILVHVSEDSRVEGDVNFYRSFGIEPMFCSLVSVKACTSFRAGYLPIADEICNAATPGAAGPVLTDLPFKARPKPLYPFEEIGEKDIKKAKIYR